MTEIEHRCFIGGLSWSTTDKGLQNAFGKFGHLTEAKVAMDRYSGRSRGFGFVTFEDKQSMEDAIEEMNGVDLDGRTITVEKGQPQRSGGRDRGDPGYDRYRGRDYGGGRSFGGGGGGGGSGGDGCFTCGKIGHFARECPSGDGGRGDRYGSREDKYGGREDKYGGREDKYGGREDKYGGREDRYGGREDRYGGREDKYGGGGSGRYGSDRGDRYGGGGRSREGRSGDRYGRDRSAPYDRHGSGGQRM